MGDYKDLKRQMPCNVLLLRIKLKNRINPMSIKFFPPFEKRKLDPKSALNHGAADLRAQFSRSRSSAAGGNQIIGDNHPRAAVNRVYMNFQGICAVLQLVARLVRFVG